MTTLGKLLFSVPRGAPAARTVCDTGEKPPESGPVARDGPSVPSWLGLETSHRVLFDASQDGWIRPTQPVGLLLGQESFVSEDFHTKRSIVPVRLAFDVDRLPFPDARKDLDRGSASGGYGTKPRVVRWRSPIPLYAVAKVEVSSSEQKTRLLAMADQFSNVSLPAPEIVVNHSVVHFPESAGSEIRESGQVQLPENLNAIQGAMAMAVWAVPRVEPWIEMLRQGLNRDSMGVERGATSLNANWLQLPWLVETPTRPVPDDGNGQERLWYAALSCMRYPTAENKSPVVLAEEIAQAAAAADGAGRTAENWLAQTLRILAAEKTITCDDWQECGAGLAIRLVLLRPHPMRFTSWSTDLPGLAPAVWWAAATLCGWYHGYRSLDRRFRGNAKLQEFLATRALAVSWGSDDPSVLPRYQHGPLERARDNGCFALTWRGCSVIRKPWHSRARWYSADLADVTVGSAARGLASQLGWPCLERWLVLPERRIPIMGDGQVSVDGDALVITGRKSLRLADGVDIEERLDPDRFHRDLATEAGVVPEPPVDSRRQAAPDTGLVLDPHEAPRRQTTAEAGLILGPPQAPGVQAASDIPGLVYEPDFVAEEEETKLLAWIDGAEWSTKLRRRVQQYGWRYDYGKRRIDKSMRIGELPRWAQELAQRLVANGLVGELPDQLIVNEYCGNQGIAPHIDQPSSFAEHVSTVSLLETWGMVFRHRKSGKRVEIPLERRSVAVLAGAARYRWTHEIPSRKTELLVDQQGKRRRMTRSRRVSLTFRATRLR